MSTETVQLVLLLIDHRRYAIESSSFQEVIRSGVVTPIPFVPSYIEGLVNVEGRIATQMDLGRLFAGTERASPGIELAFVQTGRSLCALRVQQVIAIIERDASDIHYFRQGAAQAEHDDYPACVTGELVHEGQQVVLLDPHAIGLLVHARAIPEGQGGLSARAAARKIQSHSQQNHYLVVESGNERYGFSIDRIIELVKSSACTPIPGAPATVRGLTLVRGQPVLTLDLQGLLQRKNPGAAYSEWVILVHCDTQVAGLMVDRVVGIEEYVDEKITRIDDLTSALSGVVENEGGNITMLVEPQKLLAGESTALVRQFAPVNHHQAEIVLEKTRPCLSVLVGDERFAIPLDKVSRVMQYKAYEGVHDDGDRIVGAIDVEGRVVPVVNMRASTLDGNKAEWSEYVIVEQGNFEYAIRVSQTHNVVDLPEKNINNTGNTANPFVAAIAHYDGQLYSLFNSQHLDEGQFNA